jgi:hypothetical protein
MRYAAPVRVALAILLAGAVTACDSTSPPVPEVVEITSPADQTATVGTAVAALPSLRVTSSTGVPVPGVAVSFAVVAGGGTITGAEQVTDARGEARLAGWTVGTTAGDNTVRATAAGIAAPVTFRAGGAADAPWRLGIVTEPPTTAASGALLSPQPAVQLYDRHGNATGTTGVNVTASVIEPGAALENAVAATDVRGRAQFTSLKAFGPSGSYTLTFAVPAAPDLGSIVAASAVALVAGPDGECADALALNFNLGEMRRVTLDSPGNLTCLDFDATRNAGQQYLVMLENMPMFGGDRGSSLFPSTSGTTASARTFEYTLRSTPRSTAAATAQVAAQRVFGPVAPPEDRHSWDFGGGVIYEHTPEPPPAGTTAPYFRAASGQMLDVTGAQSAALQVGDTIHNIRMEGIPRLNIPTGNQSAVVRHISDELIIAEDVRLTTTLRRQGGAFNTPLHADTMAAIAQQYAAIAKAQSDRLFDGRHNAAVENGPLTGGRVLAVHSIMYADNIWGYTYSSFDYFVWDYWVGTNGSQGGPNQMVQRNADNLFMHEIAHMREVGMLQRAGATTLRGNTWMVEGFARFSERLPIASRLLGTVDVSRTGNIVLPRNPSFGNSYFRDDVPTYLNVHSPMVGGYHASSYVFDYFADQVALRGGDWAAALREFVVASGRPALLDSTVDRWVGGTFGELFTRARLALYLDDIGTPGLPAWTQYHQYRLRESRPVGSGTDARDSWQKLAPGTAINIESFVGPGAAWGYVIDGGQATGSSVFTLSGPRTDNAVMSVTRIR